jgi:hypothetical protein
LPAFGREKIANVGIIPLWQRGARGDFSMHVSIHLRPLIKGDPSECAQEMIKNGQQKWDEPVGS